MAKKKSKEIKTVPFLTDVPEGTISIEINVKMLVEGKIVEGKAIIDDSASIHKNMVAGAEYEWDHAVFSLTDKALTEMGDK
jgi:hypothetical protein